MRQANWNHQVHCVLSHRNSGIQTSNNDFIATVQQYLGRRKANKKRNKRYLITIYRHCLFCIFLIQGHHVTIIYYYIQSLYKPEPSESRIKMVAKKDSIISNRVLEMAGPAYRSLHCSHLTMFVQEKSSLTATLNYGLFCDSACIYKQSCVLRRVLTELQLYIKIPC